MARFLTTLTTRAAIQEVISGAKAELTIICPYNVLSDDLQMRLKDAAGRGVRITFVCRQKPLADELERLLRGLPGLILVHDEKLHAKCYYNETQMVITSFNLLISSEQNWEMGVQFDVSEDAYTAAKAEAQLMIRNAKALPPLREASRATNAGEMAAVSGYCLRCRNALKFNPERPYCSYCYASWSKWGNWNYKERNCHKCGGNFPTTRENPLCSKCAPAKRSWFRLW